MHKNAAIPMGMLGVLVAILMVSATALNCGGSQVVPIPVASSRNVFADIAQTCGVTETVSATLEIANTGADIPLGFVLFLDNSTLWNNVLGPQQTLDFGVNTTVARFYIWNMNNPSDAQVTVKWSAL